MEWARKFAEAIVLGAFGSGLWEGIKFVASKIPYFATVINGGMQEFLIRTIVFSLIIGLIWFFKDKCYRKKVIKQKSSKNISGKTFIAFKVTYNATLNIINAENIKDPLTNELVRNNILNFKPIYSTEMKDGLITGYIWLKFIEPLYYPTNIDYDPHIITLDTYDSHYVDNSFISMIFKITFPMSSFNNNSSFQFAISLNPLRLNLNSNSFI